MKGFTLVELIAVIVVLSIVSAVAVPRFVDLSEAAQRASADGVAGALGSASALNLSTYIVSTEFPDTPMAAYIPISGCSGAFRLLEGGLPTGYKIEPTGSSGAVDPLDQVSCDVVDESDSAVRSSFVLHGVRASGS